MGLTVGFADLARPRVPQTIEAREVDIRRVILERKITTCAVSPPGRRGSAVRPSLAKRPSEVGAGRKGLTNESGRLTLPPSASKFSQNRCLRLHSRKNQFFVVQANLRQDAVL